MPESTADLIAQDMMMAGEMRSVMIGKKEETGVLFLLTKDEVLFVIQDPPVTEFTVDTMIGDKMIGGKWIEDKTIENLIGMEMKEP